MSEAAVYTTQEVALFLKTTPDTVLRGARDGLIPCLEISPKRIVFPRPAIDAWLAMPGFQLAVLLRQLSGEGGTVSLATRAHAAVLLEQAKTTLGRIERLIEDSPNEEPLRLVK